MDWGKVIDWVYFYLDCTHDFIEVVVMVEALLIATYRNQDDGFQLHVTVQNALVISNVPIIARAYIPDNASNSRFDTTSYTLCQLFLWRRCNSIRNLRLYLRNHAQQLLYDLIPLLTPCLLYLFHLLLCVFAGVLFGFLVATRVLSIVAQSAAALARSLDGRGRAGSGKAPFFRIL